MTKFSNLKISRETTALLVFADGTVLQGKGIGTTGKQIGEVCFNTGMSGYQEIISDPSYAGQIITFTFPHIGNVGTNAEDIETDHPAARGIILREDITEPESWRAQEHFNNWLVENGIPGICGLDTRAITRMIRDKGAQNAVICHDPGGNFDLEALYEEARGWNGLHSMDLAKEVSCKHSYQWDQTLWSHGSGYGIQETPRYHVVTIDYGVKKNILRNLAAAGCKVTVVPAGTSAEDILSHNPDGIFLSNGPGDPSATGEYAVPTVKKLIESGKPVFGICLGHQILALALGAKTEKMHLGHRGANHPVKNLHTGTVEITSQNHGFEVLEGSLPSGIKITHKSLFDDSNEGLALEGKPVFSVQYHPEASPGPQDSHYLFEKFVAHMAANA